MKVIMSVDIECQLADAQRVLDQVQEAGPPDGQVHLRGIHPAPMQHFHGIDE